MVWLWMPPSDLNSESSLFWGGCAGIKRPHVTALGIGRVATSLGYQLKLIPSIFYKLESSAKAY